MVSINSINAFSNQHQKVQQINAIRPETQQELKTLGISTQNVKTEAQAQEIIKQFKELQQVQNQIQAGQETKNIQDVSKTQQVNNVEKNEQTQAFAGGQAGAIQGQQPFEMFNQIVAQQNRLKLGLL